MCDYLLWRRRRRRRRRWWWMSSSRSPVASSAPSAPPFFCYCHRPSIRTCVRAAPTGNCNYFLTSFDTFDVSSVPCSRRRVKRRRRKVGWLVLVRFFVFSFFGVAAKTSRESFWLWLRRLWRNFPSSSSSSAQSNTVLSVSLVAFLHSTTTTTTTTLPPPHKRRPLAVCTPFSNFFSSSFLSLISSPFLISPFFSSRSEFPSRQETRRRRRRRRRCCIIISFDRSFATARATLCCCCCGGG